MFFYFFASCLENTLCVHNDFLLCRALCVFPPSCVTMFLCLPVSQVILPLFVGFSVCLCVCFLFGCLLAGSFCVPVHLSVCLSLWPPDRFGVNKLEATSNLHNRSPARPPPKPTDSCDRACDGQLRRACEDRCGGARGVTVRVVATELVADRCDK